MTTKAPSPDQLTDDQIRERVDGLVPEGVPPNALMEDLAIDWQIDAEEAIRAGAAAPPFPAKLVAAARRAVGRVQPPLAVAAGVRRAGELGPAPLLLHGPPGGRDIEMRFEPHGVRLRLEITARSQDGSLSLTGLAGAHRAGIEGAIARALDPHIADDDLARIAAARGQAIRHRAAAEEEGRELELLDAEEALIREQVPADAVEKLKAVRRQRDERRARKAEAEEALRLLHDLERGVVDGLESLLIDYAESTAAPESRAALRERQAAELKKLEGELARLLFDVIRVKAAIQAFVLIDAKSIARAHLAARIAEACRAAEEKGNNDEQ